MRSDSSKHGSDMDVLKNTFNIKPLKKIEESKFKVFSREDNVKEISFYFKDFS